MMTQTLPCPDCDYPLAQSEVDPTDPYWYCAADECDFTGETVNEPVPAALGSNRLPFSPRGNGLGSQTVQELTRRRNPIARALRTLRPKVKPSGKLYRRRAARKLATQFLITLASLPTIPLAH